MFSQGMGGPWVPTKFIWGKQTSHGNGLAHTHQSSASLSLRPAELWNLTTPELEALVIVALAAAVIPMEGPLPDTLVSVESARVCCIWVLAAASRVEVST